MKFKIVSVDESGTVFERYYDNLTASFSTMENENVTLNIKTVNEPKTCECGDSHTSATNSKQECNTKQSNQQQCITNSNTDCNAPKLQNNQQQCNTNSNCNAQSNSQSNMKQMNSQQNKKFMNKMTWDGKSQNIKLLKIQLGLGCNYNCTYCKQSIHVSGAAKSNVEDVKKFIETFDTWCKTPSEDQMQIQLWGGEPLLYFEEIKLLVTFFKTRFKSYRLSLLSNGSLLTKEIADFFIENNVSYSISHDGAGQLVTRLNDPLAEGSESLKWIKYYIENSKSPLYVNMVLSKQNHNPKAGIDYIKSILGDKVQAGYEGIVVVENPDQFDTESFFTEEDYYELRDIFKETVLSGEAKNINPFNKKVDNLMKDWTTENFSISDTHLQKCGMDDPYVLAVNLKGEVLVCHSVNTVIGSVNEFKDIKMSNGGVGHWSKKDECKTCPVLNMCYGACMNMHDDSWFYTCNNEFNFNLAIFEATFEMMFGEKIIEIDGEFVRPKLKADK